MGGAGGDEAEGEKAAVTETHTTKPIMRLVWVTCTGSKRRYHDFLENVTSPICLSSPTSPPAPICYAILLYSILLFDKCKRNKFWQMPSLVFSAESSSAEGILRAKIRRAGGAWPGRPQDSRGCPNVIKQQAQTPGVTVEEFHDQNIRELKWRMFPGLINNLHNSSYNFC